MSDQRLYDPTPVPEDYTRRHVSRLVKTILQYRRDGLADADVTGRGCGHEHDELPERIVTFLAEPSVVKLIAEYAQARRVGEMLADAGYTICTGGYLGVMEAASRGAHERGGRVLGIVMNQFKAEPNRYLTDKVATPHFYERLQQLITRSVGFIAIRGGMGTVTELSLVWNKIQTSVIGPRPLVLLRRLLAANRA